MCFLNSLYFIHIRCLTLKSPISTPCIYKLLSSLLHKNIHKICRFAPALIFAESVAHVETCPISIAYADHIICYRIVGASRIRLGIHRLSLVLR